MDHRFHEETLQYFPKLQNVKKLRVAIMQNQTIWEK